MNGILKKTINKYLQQMISKWRYGGIYMKILFCGTNVPDEIEFVSHEVSAAGNRYQNNLIRCLRGMGHQVYNLAYIGVMLEQHTGDTGQLAWQPDYDYVYCSGKSITARVAAHRSYQVKMKAAAAECDIVISYNVFHAWLNLPTTARRAGKKSIVFLADYTPAEGCRDLLHKAYAHRMLDAMQRYDTVVGLSDNIMKLCRHGQRFILMEGGIDQKVYDYFGGNAPCIKEGGDTVFMYSGLLSDVTGVDILLDAMKRLERQDISLVITGKGELDESVRAAAAADRRIIFKGHLPYEEYLRQLASADVLVNPRNMDLPENRNNFPSKIMDYLASGRKIISTKFAGYERFSGYMEFCDPDAASLACRISAAADNIKRNDKTVDTYSANRLLAKDFLWQGQLGRLLEIK